MKTVVLISCVSKKRQDGIYPAGELYLGPLFKNSFEYAKNLKPDMIHILSAKYHLIRYDNKIGSYDLTLNNMKEEEIKNWSEKVFKQLQELYDIENTKFIILAGSNYYIHLIPLLKHVELPLGCLPLGYRIQWLQQAVKNQRRSK